MAAVLGIEDSNYFGGGGPLRRTHSQSHFVSAPSSFDNTSRIGGPYNQIAKGSTYAHSEPSSAPSSPRTAHGESTDLSSYASTPVSNFSIVSDYEDTLAYDQQRPEEDFSFPSYSQTKFFNPTETPDEGLEPPPSPKTGDSYTPSPVGEDYLATTRPESPELTEHAEDDTALTTRPSRQVDYLSHEWREEDIWSSWRYIVSRRGQYANSERLENASWRTWMKARNNLRTISPESLNWLKDCDVTWLYGPLQQGPGSNPLTSSNTYAPSSSLSKTNSLVNLIKKPILKKRSMSEVMLQRSLSNASLLKQAAAAVQAQERRGILRPHLGRSATDYGVALCPSSSLSRGTSSITASTESSGITSPSTEKKHIHFNEQVEQCIAIEVKGEEDEMDMNNFYEDTDSDGVMMKTTRSKRHGPQVKRRAKKTATAEGKIIEKLPSTTLKYREDTPEPRETAMKHSTGTLRNSLLSPSSSQETLRPSNRAGRFFLGDDEDLDDGFYDPNTDWSSPPPEPSLLRSPSTGSLLDEPVGMRRTPSGMFMPFDEGEGSGEGIFGRVIDTVNTARDIAHVIWNVGWRK